MKTNTKTKCGLKGSVAFAAGLLLSVAALAPAIAGEQPRQIVVTARAGADEEDQDATPKAVQKKIIIRAIEPESGNHAARELTWLGVSVEDVSEPLAAQLGLKPGEGLLVSYVSADSPAAKAELKKNDVLVEFEGQMLVDPLQLRKLVQMHADGDSVKVTFYRGGKKQSATARLVKKAWDETALGEGSPPEGLRQLQFQLQGLPGKEDLAEHMSALAQSLAKAGLDKERIKIEIERTVEQTRQAIQDAMRHARGGPDSNKDLGLGELAELAGGGVHLGKDTIVVVKRDGKSSKTVVKTDDSGSYVIVADPAKHLTAHDPDGKLLFDGPIESPEEQKKVPAEVWEKIQPLLEQMATGKIEDEAPEAQPEAPAK